MKDMKRTFSLLVVEDSEDDAALLIYQLQRDGFDPIWRRVESPEEMARALEEREWDLVVSDHGMPRFSAPAAMAMLRKRYLETPFIIVSGTMGEEAAVEAMRSGAQDYILKGKLGKLSVAVSRELREAELRRAHAKSEETLRQTRERLDTATQQLVQAEKLTALGELVAGVAHEINNPLSGILGFTQLVLKEDLAPGVRRRLETVCSEAERAAGIVKNLLAFARKHPPEKRYLGLNGIVEKTLELKAYHFRTNQIAIETDLPQDLPKTMLDFHQIQQVILNLLNNAEHAMIDSKKSGGTIKLVSRHTGGKLELTVSDTGPGVPAQIQGRIFEPFFTTKKEGKGTGLGLSLCYGIIQEHGGSLGVKSEPGNGASFIVELPIVQNIGSVAVKPSAEPARATQWPSLDVLVVDDESAVQGFLLEFLTSQGHRVDTASDVPEALRKIQARTYTLVITDMKMPRGTGKDIYEAIGREHPHLTDRVIFTTGEPVNSEMLDELRQRGTEILMKPYRLEDVERVIRKIMGRAGAIKAAGGPGPSLE
ncbi:MAG TPA: response regulator [Candidatus Polarisedimenticolia bacterium]|nr:response regulator [Candidatus Polarisedimenticolia bacterium]